MTKKKQDNHSESNISSKDWHSYKESEVFEELNSSFEGLDSKEAEKRLDTYGKNKLPAGKKVTLRGIILHQLINPLIFILIAAAIASIAIGEAKDAIFIFLVIIINSGLGAYQEFSAEKSASSLQSLLKIRSRVRRDKQKQNLDSEDLVPGDIVFLESGLKVPADMRLTDASNLAVDESFLTGESVAANKKTGQLQKNIAVSERTNIAFAGSVVVSGRGIGIVVGTGMDSEVGKIAQHVTESTSAKPPLILRMEKFVKQISLFLVVLSVVLAIILHYQGMDTLSIFFYIVALAVSAIPEGLPVALTVALSIATKRMAKRNVIVRKLTSVESLGSCTVIASDKTGTLTVNEQTAKKIILPNGTSFSISGEGYNGEGKVTDDSKEKDINEVNLDQLKEINNVAVLANEGSLDLKNDKWEHQGDAMDVALLGMSYKMEINPEKIRSENKIEDTIPYESERKFSAAFYNKDKVIHIGIKGAVETLLDFCSSMADGDKIVDIDKDHILKHTQSLAKKGYRVLAFAGAEYKNFQKKETYKNEDIPSLVLLGLVGFIDPLRNEARSSVEKCRYAGIKVIMITGDHPETAGTIAMELGITNEKTTVVTGKMLSEAEPPDSAVYKKLVASSSVFARASPTQKVEIVNVLIDEGEFVAVTGDGVNDAPALKRANIGIAMGSGTDVAKEVGAMIIIDDNFASIVAGVEEGRFAYDNVRKVVYLLISTGAAEVLLFIASIFAGLPLPLLAVQLLWLNLVTNGIQDVALAFEGGEAGAMKKKPRKPSEKIFNPLMIKQTIVSGATIASVVFGFWYYLNNYTQMNEYQSRNSVLLLMVFMQNLHAFNCRSESTSMFKMPLNKNYMLVFGVILAQGIHILSMQIPFMQNLLKTEPITMQEWLLILTLALPIILVMELFKIFNKKGKNQLGK